MRKVAKGRALKAEEAGHPTFPRALETKVGLLNVNHFYQSGGHRKVSSRN